MLKQEDFKDNEKVIELIQKLNDMDEHYMVNEIRAIARKQPFIISLLLGYQTDFNDDELDDIAKVLLLIWKYFKDISTSPGKQIQATQFEKVQERNFSMLKYLDKVETQEEHALVTESDLSHLKAKALLTGVMFQFDHLRSLERMGLNEKSMLIIGMKSLIECFETV